MRGLAVEQPLNADQVEDLPLVLGEALNYLQHASAVRAQSGRRRCWTAGNAGFRQLGGSGPFIQAAGQVIELPAHVLVGQREEPAHRRGAGRPQGREQPGHDAPEQLIRLQVHGGRVSRG